MKKLLSLILLVSFGASSFSAEFEQADSQLLCSSETNSHFAVCLEALDKASLGPTTACITPSTTSPNPNPKKAGCQEKYDKMFADGKVNITYAGGYFDMGGTTNDGVISEKYSIQIIERLTSQCPGSYQVGSRLNYNGHSEDTLKLKKDQENGCGKKQSFNTTCGFRRSDDPEIFTKTIQSQGKTVQVKVRVAQSALSKSDKVNRATTLDLLQRSLCASVKSNPSALKSCISKNTPPLVMLEKFKPFCLKGDEHRYQICRSLYVKRIWSESLSNGDDIVTYDGHARDGGGPSFEPPKVLSNGHVDYDWYQKIRPGHRAESAALEAGAKKGKAPAFYANLSCNGILHFVKRGNLPSASPSTAYILSKRSVFGDEGVAAFLSTVEGALGRKCGNALGESIEGASCGLKLTNF